MDSIKRAVALTAVALLAPIGAIAGECDADLAKVDAQFTSVSPHSPQVLAQVHDLRTEARQLCEEGDVAAGMDLLSQAKQTLGIQ